MPADQDARFLPGIRPDRAVEHATDNPELDETGRAQILTVDLHRQPPKGRDGVTPAPLGVDQHVAPQDGVTVKPAQERRHHASDGWFDLRIGLAEPSQQVAGTADILAWHHACLSSPNDPGGRPVNHSCAAFRSPTYRGGWAAARVSRPITVQHGGFPLIAAPLS